ncbi:MAG: hypothetical protein KDE19_11110 [Caldilineaceae bacterium]|nr:hypothetical protein [Caldilineaceae bacterium]
MGVASSTDCKIWELDAEAVLRYDNPMLLPFVPLMNGGGTEQVVRRCAQRIRREPVTEAAELEAVLAIFASYVLDVQTIRYNLYQISNRHYNSLLSTIRMNDATTVMKRR